MRVELRGAPLDDELRDHGAQLVSRAGEVQCDQAAGVTDDLAAQRQRVRLAGEREPDVDDVAELDRERRLHQQALGRDVDGHALARLVAAAQRHRQLGVHARVAVAAHVHAVGDLEAQPLPVPAEGALEADQLPAVDEREEHVVGAGGQQVGGDAERLERRSGLDERDHGGIEIGDAEQRPARRQVHGHHVVLAKTIHVPRHRPRSRVLKRISD